MAVSLALVCVEFLLGVLFGFMMAVKAGIDVGELELASRLDAKLLPEIHRDLQRTKNGA